MSIEIVYDGFELKMGENHIFSDDWIFPLFETDINLVPLEHIQTCFAFCNMPIVMTAGHYADLFNDLKPDLFDNLVYPPKNIFNKIPYSSVLRYNQDRTRLISYPIIQSVFGSNFDIALLLVGNSFNVTPNIQICQDPLINAEVTCIGFPHICSISEKRPLISINDGNIQSLNTEKYRMCWYPSIEINTEIIGGMSGGPTLIKETNEIIGVNSRSFNFPEGPGYSTWIGEAMTNVFSFNAKIVYEDNSEFDLREFTLKEIIEFSSKRDNLNHKLAMV